MGALCHLHHNSVIYTFASLLKRGVLSKERICSSVYEGWSGGAMVLGKHPVAGRPTILIAVGHGPIALAVGAGGCGLEFLLSSILSPLSPSLWETARYRLKYCLKGPLKHKTTNQPTSVYASF